MHRPQNPIGRTGSKCWMSPSQVSKVRFVLFSYGSWSSLLLGSKSCWWSSSDTVDIILELTNPILVFLLQLVPWRERVDPLSTRKLPWKLETCVGIRRYSTQRQSPMGFAWSEWSDRVATMNTPVLRSGYGRSWRGCLSNDQTWIPRRSHARWCWSTEYRSVVLQWNQTPPMVHGWSEKYWQRLDRNRRHVSSIVLKVAIRVDFFS